MRRILIIIVLFAVFSSLFGCSKEETTCKVPVKVYYCSEDITYNTENGVIQFEIREYSGWEDKIRDFLNIYLRGTDNSELSSPFPLGSWILQLEQIDNQANLFVNNHFSRLSPAELSLSCACLSMTVMELIDVEAVNIRIDGAGSESAVITMTKDNLSFADDTLIN